MSFFTETVSVVVAIVIADCMMDADKCDRVAAKYNAACATTKRGATYLRDEAMLAGLRLRAKVAA